MENAHEFPFSAADFPKRDGTGKSENGRRKDSGQDVDSNVLEKETDFRSEVRSGLLMRSA